MALKKETGEYLRVAVMEGVNLNHGIAYIRIYEHYTEQGRKDKPFEPDKNYCVQEIKLNADQIDVLQKMSYDLVKNHKVKTGEKENKKTGKKTDVFDTPFADLTDC